MPKMPKKLEKKMYHKMFSLVKSEKAYDPSLSMTVSGVANMAKEDRMSDIILKEAWQVDNYKNNPVILFNHCYDNLVGKATDIQVTELGLEITAQIGDPEAGYELTDIQKNIRSLLAQGILKAFSVGFFPLEAEYDETNNRFVITKAELLEVSLVSVPCQQESLISEVKNILGKGEKKAMDEEMKAALTGIADGVKSCLEKISSIESKMGEKPEEKPNDAPSPVEEGLKAENVSLKANLAKTEKALQDLVNLVK